MFRTKRRWPVPFWLVCVLAIGHAPVAPCMASADDYQGIEARISTPSFAIAPNEPVVLEFTLRNTTDKPVVLSVPGVAADPAGPIIELPIAHVFSGEGYTGLTIRGDYDHTWSDVFGYHPPARAQEIVIGPHAVVGRVVDVTEYYPPLRSPGMYRVVWQPYAGLVVSNQLTLDIAPLKQAVVITDDGSMTMRFRYDLAPNHVANFIELARAGFYNNKTIHRVEPGCFLQTGCPNGDGTGIRLDGKKLKAEFSDASFERGTVCMARLESDPDSASCQFIICNTRLPEWDGRYTIFGELVGQESLDTLQKLMSTPVDPETGRPERSLFIRGVRIVDAPEQP